MCKVIPVLFCLSGTALAVGGGDGNPGLKTSQASLERWRGLRVGAFIHWTPYVLASGRQPPAEGYDRLYARFKAEHFDPDEWVRILKRSGFRYVVYTTKHGDSCCMWNTRETDYNVMNSPMRCDVFGELASACKRQGMPFCPYYALHNDSQNHPDWTDQVDPATGLADYKARTKPGDAQGYHLAPNQDPDFGRYFTHVKAQLKELSDNYGPFLAWWFDQRCPTLNHKHGTELYAFLRNLQPDVLVSNRVDTPFDRGLDNPTWFVTEGKSAGDYAVSEIAIPRFHRDIPWEYCQAAGKPDAWFWRPDDVYRPLDTWIRELVEVVCRDGNYLLGFGAMPDGRFDPRLLAQLRQLGSWLHRNGDSVYGTRGGPFKANSWYGSTCKGNCVYLHVWKTDENQTLTAPPLGKRVLRCRSIDGKPIEMKQTAEGVTVRLGRADIQRPDTIVVLELEGDAGEVRPVEEETLTASARVRASSVPEDKNPCRPESTIDGNEATYWTTSEGVFEGWLEYDLDRPRTFSRAIVEEGEDEWIRHIQIQAKMGNQWKTVFEYRHGDPELWKNIPMEVFCPEFRFDPTTAQFVRLNVIAATKCPVIREFLLHER